MEEGQNATAEGRRPRSRGMAIAVWIAGVAAVIVLVFAAVFAGAARVPGLAGACGACHEIAPQVAAWRASSHANTGCRSCHYSYAWYDGMRYRVTFLASDVSRFLSGDFTEPSASQRSGATGAIAETPDAVCLRCHTLSRQPSAGDRVIIDHADHAERNAACLSCHLNTTHPDPEADIVLLMMEQCYECHSLTAVGNEPSGACDVCHPEHLQLTPASHDPLDVWQRPAHGESAKVERDQCTMCHFESSCIDCHGLEMPHPAWWTSPDAGHGEFASANREVCGRCHTGEPDPCSACHHSLENATIESWEEQHYVVARLQGPAACMRCHKGDFCAQCHYEDAALE